MNYWEYSNENGHTAIIKQTGPMNEVGVFQGIFVWLKMRNSKNPEKPQELLGSFMFRENDEEKGYSMIKIKDPNEMLKDLL